MTTKTAEQARPDRSRAKGGSAGRGGVRAGAGAKAADGVTGVQRYQVTLDAASEAIARRLGDGDRSLGIRRALALADR